MARFIIFMCAETLKIVTFWNLEQFDFYRRATVGLNRVRLSKLWVMRTNMH